MLPTDLTLQAIGFRVLALLILVAVQGAVVAGTAVLLRDKGPKYDGRLTLLPTAHVDPVGGIAFLLYGIGWGRPVMVDARELRGGLLGMISVILAGFVALILLAWCLNLLAPPALTTLPHTAALTTSAFLREASRLALGLALLSLVPIPPLTAGMLWNGLGIRIPQQVQLGLAVLLFIAIAAGLVRPILSSAAATLGGVILGN